jgi:NAD(P)H-dependent flavin oxidoreductase YrpB (nitropropane dioxygenase family)
MVCLTTTYLSTLTQAYFRGLSTPFSLQMDHKIVGRERCPISTSQNQMVRDRAASAPVLADIDLQKVSEGQRRAVLGQE